MGQRRILLFLIITCCFSQVLCFEFYYLALFRESCGIYRGDAIFQLDSCVFGKKYNCTPQQFPSYYNCTEETYLDTQCENLTYTRYIPRALCENTTHFGLISSGNPLDFNPAERPSYSMQRYLLTYYPSGEMYHLLLWLILQVPTAHPWHSLGHRFPINQRVQMGRSHGWTHCWLCQDRVWCWVQWLWRLHDPLSTQDHGGVIILSVFKACGIFKFGGRRALSSSSRCACNSRGPKANSTALFASILRWIGIPVPCDLAHLKIPSNALAQRRIHCVDRGVWIDIQWIVCGWHNARRDWSTILWSSGSRVLGQWVHMSRGWMHIRCFGILAHGLLSQTSHWTSMGFEWICGEIQTWGGRNKRFQLRRPFRVGNQVKETSCSWAVNWIQQLDQNFSLFDHSKTTWDAHFPSNSRVGQSGTWNLHWDSLQSGF